MILLVFLQKLIETAVECPPSIPDHAGFSQIKPLEISSEWKIAEHMRKQSIVPQLKQED